MDHAREQGSMDLFMSSIRIADTQLFNPTTHDSDSDAVWGSGFRVLFAMYRLGLHVSLRLGAGR